MVDQKSENARRCGFARLRRGVEENMAALDCFVVALDHEFSAESLCDVMIPLIRLGESEEARLLLAEGLECRPEIAPDVLARVHADQSLAELRSPP